jgi:MFS transporter, ACS family, hexuronate transporter
VKLTVLEELLMPGLTEAPTTLKTPYCYRWTICGLLFFATTINYIDRQILGILAPVLQAEIRWSESEYGLIVTAFQAAYALGLLIFGWFIDKYGTKIGYAVSIASWSIAAMAHVFARTPFGFGVARAALGLSESGNFPAAVKAVAEWFPKRDRAFATGIFNSGANLGAMIAPAVVPWLTFAYGWRAAFVATAAIGFLWVVLWVRMYEKPEHHKKLTKDELGYILSDPPDQPIPKIPWLKLLNYRQTWAFVLGKFITDPIWWFYLYWLPKFLNKNYGLKLTDLGLPLIAIYTMTCIGSISGGWISSRFIKRGMPVNRSRELVMLICALCVVPIVVASRAANVWSAVALIGLAAAAHQGWAANMFTLPSDMFPKKAIGSIMGIGGMAGSVGSMIFSASAGYVLEWTGSYLSLFIISGSAYLIALGLMKLLTSKAMPVEL